MNAALVVIGAVILVAGVFVTVWASDYERIEPIPGGYRTYYIRSEVVASFAAVTVLGAVILVAGLVVRQDDRSNHSRKPSAIDMRAGTLPVAGRVNYCANCGHPLSGTPFCPYCGSKLH